MLRASEMAKRSRSELQTVQTATSIPVVNLVWTKTHDGYEKVKNSNALIRWYLSTTEATMNTVARLTLPIVERPLNAVDGLTSKGIDLLMTKVPAVKTPPEQIVSTTKSFVSERAAAVGNFGLNTSNAVLNNRVGLYFLGTVDKVAHCTDETVGKYLPKPVDESEVKKFLPEDNNELAKTLNNISGVLAVAAKRLMRKRRTTANINKLKELATSSADKLKGQIERIRRRIGEDENEIVSVRTLATDLIKTVDATDYVNDGLSEDQRSNLKLVRENVQTIAYILEQTPKVKDMTDEAVEDLRKKIQYVRNTLTEIIADASANWYKIPEENIVAAKIELELEKPSEQLNE